MKKLTFELEFITPAFIGSANPLKPELRPASFVGLLRFWWRALRSECDINKLREEETDIFGGDGKNASKVMLRVWGDVGLEERSFGDVYKLQWGFDKNRRTLTGPHGGIGYLFFSNVLRDRVKGFITAGSKFSITLLGEQAYLNHYIASLWALVFLGGVGSRSRRGGGNLAVVKAPEGLPISFEPLGDIVQWYKINLEKAKQLVGSSQGRCEKYSNLSNVKIKVGDKAHNSWIEALNEIGTRFMQYRLSVRNKIFDSAIFGIPVRHTNGWVKATKGIERRSSPLIIKVVKDQGKYRWVLVRLSGDFLPEGVKLTFNKNEGYPNPGLLEGFLNEVMGRYVQ